MQLLTTTRVYGPEDDSNPDFLELINKSVPGVEILEGNAGLGADWPAGIWKSANAAAIGLAILSSPSTIEDNWPKWKEIFDTVSEAMIAFHSEYRIDRDTAQVLAIQEAVTQHQVQPDSLEVHMAIRHYFDSAPGYQDLLQSPRIDMNWPDEAEYGSPEYSIGVRSNEEASKQARCRYLFGISDYSKCLTICVESDGKISFAKEMNMDSAWG